MYRRDKRVCFRGTAGTKGKAGRCGQMYLHDSRAIQTESQPFPDDLGGEYEVLQNGVVDSCQCAGTRALGGRTLLGGLNNPTSGHQHHILDQRGEFGHRTVSASIGNIVVAVCGGHDVYVAGEVNCHCHGYEMYSAHLATELLLQLPYKPGMNLLEGLPESEGHVYDHCLASRGDLNLARAVDVEIL